MTALALGTATRNLSGTYGERGPGMTEALGRIAVIGVRRIAKWSLTKVAGSIRPAFGLL